MGVACHGEEVAPLPVRLPPRFPSSTGGGGAGRDSALLHDTATPSASALPINRDDSAHDRSSTLLPWSSHPCLHGDGVSHMTIGRPRTRALRFADLAACGGADARSRHVGCSCQRVWGAFAGPFLRSPWASRSSASVVAQRRLRTRARRRARRRVARDSGRSSMHFARRTGWPNRKPSRSEVQGARCSRRSNRWPGRKATSRWRRRSRDCSDTRCPPTCRRGPGSRHSPAHSATARGADFCLHDDAIHHRRPHAGRDLGKRGRPRGRPEESKARTPASTSYSSLRSGVANENSTLHLQGPSPSPSRPLASHRFGSPGTRRFDGPRCARARPRGQPRRRRR